MLAAHGDVVDAPNEYFELTRDGDQLYGRGVKDMKFALAGYLQVIDELYQAGTLQDLSLGLMLTMDEELGGEDGTARLLADGYRPNVVILPDGGDDWQIQSTNKGVLHYRVTAHGESTHSAYPWTGKNPIKQLLPAIAEFEALVPEPEPFVSTLSINRLMTDGANNQVPSTASFVMDIRTIDLAEHKRLQRAVHSICTSHGFDIEELATGLPSQYRLDDPYVMAYAHLIKEVTGIGVVGSMVIASGDARYYCQYNIPCISFYIPGGNHHADDEWVSATALGQFIDITRRYLEQTAH
jgi:acetylornithine deacetylase/succinyl-diaminopimelate desuccinylase-like protein